MQTLTYIEDLVNILHRKIINYEISPHHQDIGPVINFNKIITSGRLLTRKQGNFILQILKKYKDALEIVNIDNHLSTPMWRNEFRVIDTSKYIYLEVDEANITWINIKFPYSYKENFNKIFFNNERDPTRWDPKNQTRKVKITDFNLIVFVDIAIQQGFEIEETVLIAASHIEELWNNEEQLVPHSLIEDNRVRLVNASDSAIDYWNKNKVDEIEKDLLLAKQMGFALRSGQQNRVCEKLASTSNTHFWFKETEKFYQYIDKLSVSPIVFVLDRSPEPMDWTRQFVKEFPFKNFVREDLRICFRPSNNERKGREFNDWLKDQCLNKPVADGKIFICLQKPPKWMFENGFKVKVIATNSIYPSVNPITNALFSSHPTVFYFDKVKPSSKRDIKIAEL